MLDFEEIRKVLMSVSPDSDCLRECSEALKVGGLEEIGLGRMTAKEAIAEFGIREKTSYASGIDTCGMRETLDALRRMPGGAEILLFHFSEPRRLFTVFARLDTTLLGCIRVRRRNA